MSAAGADPRQAGDLPGATEVTTALQSISYNPAIQSLDHVPNELALTRLLLVGGDSPAVDAERQEVRHVKNPPPLTLPRGLYVLEPPGDAVLFISGGQPREARRERTSRLEEDDDLSQALRWFEYLWDGAERAITDAAFDVGDFVRILGSDEVGKIEHRTMSGRQVLYDVRHTDGVMRVAADGLEAVDLESADPHQWAASQPASAADAQLRFTMMKLTQSLTDTLYSYGTSKTVYRAYQFKPVLRLLRSDRRRMLIADEVGLGKTIEAGLIWSELHQRAPLQRVLVVCPAVLVTKWRDEMQRRFGFRLRLLDATDLHEIADLYRAGRHDGTQSHGVISLERLRRRGLIEGLADVRPAFDLVIVDEAHYLRNQATLSYQLGEMLSDWADTLVFLSATPLNLGEEDLFNLVNLLDPAEFPDRVVFEQQLEPTSVLLRAMSALDTPETDSSEVTRILDRLTPQRFGEAIRRRQEFVELEAILQRDRTLDAEQRAEARRHLTALNPLGAVVTRTRKADVEDKRPVREAHAIDVAWTEAEAKFYQAVRSWTEAKALSTGAPTGFVTQMPLRQTASCIPAMIRRLSIEQKLTDDDFDDVLEGGAGDWSGGTVVELRSQLSQIARAIGSVDTKYDRFAQSLDRLRDAGIRQLMVFSFFRLTLDYLHHRLSGDYRVAVLHGGVKMDERERLMASFRAGEIDILLLSEVGSEGLDFEFCNVVVNYDLPWNPMKIEQRIGRVDRFGQQAEKIFIYNFHVPGTIETDIFERLYRRLGVFERSIGALEPILRTQLADLQAVALDPRLSDDQRQAEIARQELMIAERELQLRDVGEAEGQLAGLDRFDIDGLQRDIDRGRYIGPAEVRHLFEEFLLRADTKARLRMTDDVSGVLTGDVNLSRLVNLANREQTDGTDLSFSQVLEQLSGRTPISVTFSSEVATGGGGELLAAGHPIIAAARAYFAQSPEQLGLARFATMRAPMSRAGTYLVAIYLHRTTGIRPSARIAAFAADVATNVIVEGDDLIGALARGEIEQWDPPQELDLREVIQVLLAEGDERYLEFNTGQRARNDSFVNQRLAAIEAEISYKIDRAETMLASAGDERIQRMNSGRIRNLQRDLEIRSRQLEESRKMTVTSELKQLVLVRSD